MAKKEKVLEHTSALQQNRTDPDMKVKPTLIIHRIISVSYTHLDVYKRQVQAHSSR